MNCRMMSVNVCVCCIQHLQNWDLILGQVWNVAGRTQRRINNPDYHILTLVAKYLYTCVSRKRGFISAIDILAAVWQSLCGP